jgi:hypothetical protein
MCNAPAKWARADGGGEARLDFAGASERRQMRPLLQLQEPQVAMQTEQRAKKLRAKRALGRSRIWRSVAKVTGMAAAVVVGVD